MELNNIKQTIGGHNVRNLVLDGDKLTGEVSHQYNPTVFEAVVWHRCEIRSSYFSSNLGEWWDVDLED